MSKKLKFTINEQADPIKMLTIPAEWTKPDTGYLNWDAMVDGRLYVLRVEGNSAWLERVADAEPERDSCATTTERGAESEDAR